MDAQKTSLLVLLVLKAFERSQALLQAGRNCDKVREVGVKEQMLRWKTLETKNNVLRYKCK
jgi:hypothetical protein